MEVDRFRPSEYKIDEKQLEAIFGSLEAQVLEVLWKLGKPLRVRDVYEELKKTRGIAYTTVMTTMNTLYEKGILDREVKQGRGGLLYLYWPKMDRKQVERNVVKDVLDSLMRNFGPTVATYLVENDISDAEKIEKYKKLIGEEE
jgi:predicted transcriptional regulator